MKKRIVVICPGRGSYTRESLGYLRNSPLPYLDQLNQWRKQDGEPSLKELDEAPQFQPALHTKGEHASVLIYACSASDFELIDRNRYEVVAVLGNSMGWYTALALGGALHPEPAYRVIQTMGAMMRREIIGGQLIYPIVDEDWKFDSSRYQKCLDVMELSERELGEKCYVSIELGGYLVLAGSPASISFLLKNLPKIENYPFQLVNHAAFHTPLLNGISERAFATLNFNLFSSPRCPLIDGRGKIWQPYSTDIRELYDYTLGHQVVERFDFTKSVTVALKEFAPDHLVLLGPGNSLGGALGQILIRNEWRGIKSKQHFQKVQSEVPFLLSFGVPEQKRLLER